MAEPFLGEIKIFGFGFTPRNYVACDGRLLNINQYQALYALLGRQYGGDGVQNFAVPDLRGRSPLHFSPAIPQGTRDGAEAVALTEATIPAHTHTLSGTDQTATQRAATNGAFANDVSLPVDFYAPASGGTSTPLVSLAPASLTPAGGSAGHNNLQPYLVVNVCIAVNGIYPSRN